MSQSSGAAQGRSIGTTVFGLKPRRKSFSYRRWYPSKSRVSLHLVENENGLNSPPFGRLLHTSYVSASCIPGRCEFLQPPVEHGFWKPIPMSARFQKWKKDLFSPLREKRGSFFHFWKRADMRIGFQNPCSREPSWGGPRFCNLLWNMGLLAHGFWGPPSAMRCPEQGEKAPQISLREIRGAFFPH